MTIAMKSPAHAIVQKASKGTFIYLEVACGSIKRHTHIGLVLPSSASTHIHLASAFDTTKGIRF